jgi:hypothetical protein
VTFVDQLYESCSILMKNRVLHLVLSSCVLDLINAFLTKFRFFLPLASAPVRSSRSQLVELTFFPVHFSPRGYPAINK